MLTVDLQCDVLSDRMVTVKLPDYIEPGKHKLVLVLDRVKTTDDTPDTDSIMDLFGSLPDFPIADGMTFQNAVRSDW